MYKNCKELPLKIFFDIAETGNVDLLGEGEKAVLVQTWETIVIEYGKLDHNNTIQDVIEKSDQLYTQAALYCEIKAMLLYLVGAEKQEYVDRLNELGYKIDISDRKKKIESIKNNDQRANHISTRMQFIKNDIKKYSDGKKATFDSVMAWLGSELKFEPKEDITVSRYLEYKRQISERNKAKRSNNRRSGSVA